MFTDPNWLNAFKLPLRVTSGIFLGSILLIVLEKNDVIDTSALGPIYQASLVVVAIVSGALCLTGFIGIAVDFVNENRKPALLQKRREIRKKEQDERRREAEQRALDRIQYLSEQELRYFADALRENSQSFYTWVHSPSVTTLMEKQLVQTFGGTHHQDHYPFTIPDYVWSYLLEHREEIINRDDANKAAAEEKKRKERRGREY